MKKRTSSSSSAKNLLEPSDESHDDKGLLGLLEIRLPSIKENKMEVKEEKSRSKARGNFSQEEVWADAPTVAPSMPGTSKSANFNKKAKPTKSVHFMEDEIESNFQKMFSYPQNPKPEKRSKSLERWFSHANLALKRESKVKQDLGMGGAQLIQELDDDSNNMVPYGSSPKSFEMRGLSKELRSIAFDQLNSKRGEKQEEVFLDDLDIDNASVETAYSSNEDVTAKDSSMGTVLNSIYKTLDKIRKEKTVIVFGLEESRKTKRDKENHEQSLRKLLTFMKIDHMDHDDVYRLGPWIPYETRPLIIKFVRMVDKRRFLSFRGNLKGSIIRVRKRETREQTEIRRRFKTAYELEWEADKNIKRAIHGKVMYILKGDRATRKYQTDDSGMVWEDMDFQEAGNKKIKLPA